MVYAMVQSEYSGLTSSTLLADALQVEVPSQRREFSRDDQYYEFVLERELAQDKPSIYRMASAAQRALDSNLQNPDLSFVSRLIREVQNVVQQQGPSRDSAENQQLFNVVSSAWRALRHTRDGLNSNVSTEIASLVEKSLCDRQQVILDVAFESDSVPLIQRVLNLHLVLKIIDHWVFEAVADTSEVCHRRVDAMSQIGRAINVFQTASTLLKYRSDVTQFSFFQDIEFMETLEPDFGLTDNAASTFVAGGLVTAATVGPYGTTPNFLAISRRKFKNAFSRQIFLAVDALSQTIFCLWCQFRHNKHCPRRLMKHSRHFIESRW